MRSLWLPLALLCLTQHALAQGDPRDLLPPLTAGGRYYFVAGSDTAASDEGDGSWERPWKTIMRGVDAIQPGDTLWVRGGDYREYVRVDKSGEGPDKMLAIRAMPGERAVVRGSEPLTGWTRAASEPERAIWEADWPFAGIYPSMVGAEDVPLVPLSIPAETEDLKPPKAYCQYFLGFGRGQAAMRPGSFCYDETRQKLLVWLIGDEDPNRRAMETAVRFCWYSSGNYVLVEGLSFKYGPLVVPIGGVAFVMTGPGGGGAPAEGCIVRDCEVSLSAFEGMVVRGGKRVTTVVEDCWVHHNGNGSGSFEGQGDPDTDSWVIVRRCRLTDNNLFKWNSAWHAGGKHFGNRVWFEQCELARQYASPGLWFDCHTRDIIVNGCYAHNNGQFQLFYEIGETGAFLNNIAEGGPHCCAVGVYGSSRTLVANNLITASERGLIVGGEDVAAEQVARVTCHNGVYNNVLLGGAFPLLTIAPEHGGARGNVSDYNLLWREKPPAGEEDPATWKLLEDRYDPNQPVSLAEWQESRRRDAHSRVADPRLMAKAGQLVREAGSPTISGGRRFSPAELRALFALKPMPSIPSEVGSASIKEHKPPSEAFLRKVAELLTPPAGQAMPLGPIVLPNSTRALPLNNAGFEQPKLEPKQTSAEAPGWTVSGAPGAVGTWRPMETGLWNWFPPDGDNVLALNAPADPAGEVTVAQKVAESLRPSTRYRLSVWAGQPAYSEQQPWPACRLELRAGNRALKTSEVPQPRITPHLGVWVEMVLTYTSPVRVPEGLPLQVIIRRTGRGAQACFDRVSLTATPVTP